ncbi:sensor histidine kinase [Actinomadura craniellae]|uniref:histidine kinase n=1 Tax=Actinomadura craniellae TaxID=2231787 RepID=A0A365H989_9ACTN|nr:sensor histidine kinase [Actinomadura craniellae]RAY15700.1 sensor histidine kinase [Actinomadura craniellae]
MTEGQAEIQSMARRVGRAVVAALLTGVADPPPPDQEWPAWLRWTRRLGLRRVRFGSLVGGLDLVLALILTLGTYGALDAEVHKVDPDYPPIGLLLYAALLAVPIVLRHRHPVAAWRMAALAVLWTSPRHMLDLPYVPGGVIAVLLCLYSVAVRAPREVTLGVGVLSIAGAWLMDPPTAVSATLLLLVPLLLGYTVRQRRSAQHELAEQRRRHRDAEAVLTERQRIARELHDVVAHHMSMIAIQAEASPYTVPELPDRTRQDLAEIRATALAALTEMRRILGVLRSEDAAGDTAPQPGLGRLNDLVEGARATGLTIESAVAGRPRPLPPGLDLSAYRIVQEALSNAMRHAPGSRVQVEVGYDRAALRLRVVNSAPPAGPTPRPHPAGGGHGVIGMRERAAMLGGELTAGPTPQDGFAVAAVLPLEGDA